MEFIKETPDKKNIQRQDFDINSFLIENNIEKIQEICKFLNNKKPLLLVNGFLGTGKTQVVNHALSFLNNNVITLKYNCFETTILDDILLEFFDAFKKLGVQNLIGIPKVRTENFTQKINAYFESINQPIVIVLNSFEQVIKNNKQQILDFIFHLSKYSKIKIIIISRKFDYDDFLVNYDKLAITALDKTIFEKYLRSEKVKQIGPLSNELYKYTRGYYLYTTLSLKIMKYKKMSLADFLSKYNESFLSFNDFILREAFSLIDPVSGHLFRFLATIRHPVNTKFLKTVNLYDKEKVDYFVDNFLLNKVNQLIYLPDYFKAIAENSIAENIAVKLHKSCIQLYETQLPLKPLERDLLISRQTMRAEIEYHEMFIPKKPVIMNKTVISPEFIFANSKEPMPSNESGKNDKKIENISFVFDSESDEMNIMNKIATSINKFVDISGKTQKTLSEIEGLSLTDLINLAKKEEMQYEYQKVIMIYQKALTLNNDDDYYTYLPVLYTNLAKTFKNMSDWFNALKYFELALEFYISSGDLEKIYENKYEIANIYYITYKRDRAEEILKKLLEEQLPINLYIKVNLLLSTISGFWLIKELPESVYGIEKSVLAELYFRYGLNSDKLGDFDTAIKYYKKCVETSKDIKINAYLSSALSNLASIYDEEGKSDKAIKYLLESIRLDELSENYNGIYISTTKLAEIYLSINSEKALEYLNKAKHFAVKLNEPFCIASSDVTLGDFYKNKQNYKLAINHYESALKLAVNNFTKDNIEKIQIRIDEIKKVYNEE